MQGIYRKQGKEQQKKKIEIPALFSCERGNPEQENLKNYMYVLGVKVRNMKMDLNTGGTWCQVG